MILGIDVGYSHTKVSYGLGENDHFIFKSTVDEGSLDDVITAIKVEHLEKNYIIGENRGTIDTEINKINSNTFRILLYTAIAKAMKDNTVDNEIQIVTGLPAQFYQSQKSDLIYEYKGKKVNMVLNGEPRLFTIKDIIVFPQSSGVLLTNNELLKGDVAIVDIGGFTIDISFFNGVKLKRLETIDKIGMNTLNNELAKEIKNQYCISYDVLKMDDILNTREIVRNNEIINIDNLINNVLRKHNKLIYNRLTGLKDFDIYKHVYIGGGALRLQKFIKEVDKNINEIDDNTIYANAKAFYIIGVEKFGNKEN